MVSFFEVRGGSLTVETESFFVMAVCIFFVDRQDANIAIKKSKPKNRVMKLIFTC